MALLASRSLWEQIGPQDVIVQLVGVSSNHGAGVLTVGVGVIVTEPAPEIGGLNIIRGRRRRPRPRFIIPDEPPPPSVLPADTIVDLVSPVTRRGVGLVSVETDFFLTEDEMVVLMALLEHE